MKKYRSNSKNALHARLTETLFEYMEPASAITPFVGFCYACTEISTVRGSTHVRSRQTCLEDGRLAFEAFEAELDRSAHAQMVSQAQHYFTS